MKEDINENQHFRSHELHIQMLCLRLKSWSVVPQNISLDPYNSQLISLWIHWRKKKRISPLLNIYYYVWINASQNQQNFPLPNWFSMKSGRPKKYYSSAICKQCPLIFYIWKQIAFHLLWYSKTDFWHFRLKVPINTKIKKSNILAFPGGSTLHAPWEHSKQY